VAEAMKLAALLEEHMPGGAAQGLLDRFLIGFPADGEFRRPPAGRKPSVFVPPFAVDAELSRRAADFGIERARDAASCLAGARAVLVVPSGSGHRPWDLGIETALKSADEGARVFVFGLLGRDGASARRAAELAAARKIALLASGPMATTFRLPQVDVPAGEEIAQALIVTVGEPGEAEFLGVDGLLPLIERRRGGEAGVASARSYRGGDVWMAGEKGDWPMDLLPAALSRSDRPKGDPDKDGRTQDLFGLGLVPRLARDPAVHVIAHKDGLRSAVAVLNGVVGDLNFAVRARSGRVISAQLHVPPPPNLHHLTLLAEAVERFFATGERPWPIERSLLAAEAMARITQ